MRLISAGLLIIFLVLPAWAERAVVTSQKGANVYSASGKKAKKLDRLARNAEVESLEERDGRVHVRFQGGEGWVAKSTLRLLPAKEPAAEKRVESPPAPAAPKTEPAAQEASAVASAPVPTVPVGGASGVEPAATLPAEKPSAEGGYLSQALKEEPIAKVDAGPSIVTVLGSLLVVLALVAGAVYLVKLFAGRRLTGGPKGKGIQLLGTRPLGPRQALLLVEVGGIPFLLAQSEGMVNLIAEIRDPEAVNRLNDLYGFRETPFETALRSRFDLESEEETRGRVAPATPADEEASVAALSPEDRLAALRRRRRAGEET